MYLSSSSFCSSFSAKGLTAALTSLRNSCTYSVYVCMYEYVYVSSRYGFEFF